MHPCAEAVDPLMTRRPPSVSAVAPVTERQAVVPARRSVVMANGEDMANDPPPPVAPAGVLAAVVSVARARALPVPVPTPVARNIVPTVLEAAPIAVHEVVPTKRISYH